MSKNIIEIFQSTQSSISNVSPEGAQSSEDICHDDIERAFYNAVYGDEGRKVNIGGLKIWMTASNILNYKIQEPSETKVL